MHIVIVDSLTGRAALDHGVVISKADDPLSRLIRLGKYLHSKQQSQPICRLDIMQNRLAVRGSVARDLCDDLADVFVNRHASLKQIQHDALMRGCPLAIRDVRREESNKNRRDKLNPLYQDRQLQHLHVSLMAGLPASATALVQMRRSNRAGLSCAHSVEA